MPRPQPVIIPGPTGMGGSSTISDIQFPLGDIIKLVTFLQDREANKQATLSAMKELGLMPDITERGSQTVATTEIPQDNGLSPLLAGLVNVPGTSGREGVSTANKQIDTERQAAAASPVFQKDIIEALKYKNEPQFSHVQSGLGPVSQNVKTGVFGPLFSAPLHTESGNLNFDTFVDKEGVNWRIGYSKDTGQEVTRTRQGQGKTDTTRDAYKEDAVLTRIVNAFNADPAVRKVEQMDQFSGLIVDVAKSDNPVGHASLETLMARASGEVGNLSEADKKPFGGSRALDQKMKQYFSELYKGKKTPENLQFISDLAKTFQETGQRKKMELARERAKQYSRANKGMKWTPEEIFNTLAPNGQYEEKQSPSKRPSPVF